jgi:lysozyme
VPRNLGEIMNKQSVIEQLKIDEGAVYEIYLDHLGYKTFGVGHLVLESDPEHGYPVGEPVSVERVIECLDQDLQTAVEECCVLYQDWEGLPSEVQEILVNMMFNLGRPRLSKFQNMNNHILHRRWAEAAAEGRDSLWYNQVGARAERLMTRLENV